MSAAAKRGRGFPYGSAEWRALRRRALVRDRFRCTKCGGRVRLTVNHIHPTATHPHLAWTLANLETLCAPCDNQHHREKGHRGIPWGCNLDGWPADPGHPWNKG